MTHDTRVVEDYLRELDAVAASYLTAGRRHELVAEIGEHIDEALAAGEPAGDVIGRLGTPYEIVAAEAPEARLVPVPVLVPQPRLRGQDIAAIVLLLVGGILLFIGWVVGLILLWTSDRWRTRDKWIATLLWPGGLGGMVLVGISTATSGESTTCVNDACTTTSTGPATWLVIVIFAALFVVPILSVAHLVRSARLPGAR